MAGWHHQLDGHSSLSELQELVMDRMGDCGSYCCIGGMWLLFFRTFCQNYLVVTPRGAFGSDPLSMGQVADPMQPH